MIHLQFRKLTIIYYIPYTLSIKSMLPESKLKKPQKQNKTPSTLNNGIPDFSGAMSPFMGSQLTQTDTLQNNVRSNLISNNRTLLTYAYATQGLVKVGIDIPVKDAFRGGIKINASQVDAGDIDKVLYGFKKRNLLHVIEESAIYNRLFGGAGIVIEVVGEDPKTPFNINSLKKGVIVNFYSADLWELFMTNQNQFAEHKPYVPEPTDEIPYNFYGVQLHKSRVIKILGDQAPSIVRPQLRGWGMSVLEDKLQQLNQILKADNASFELIDEVKVDVYKIANFAQLTDTPQGKNKIYNALSTMNSNKNFLNAITLDAEDSYDQKQINLTGLSDFKQELKKDAACVWQIPMTKLFGLSAAGFSSGEDDIENYNAMIESVIRSKYQYVLHDIVKILFQIELGFIPEEIDIEFKPLRILSALQEEEIKDKKFTRLNALFDKGILGKDELIKLINLDNLVGNELQESNQDVFSSEINSMPQITSIDPIKSSNQPKILDISLIQRKPEIKAINPIYNAISKFIKRIRK